MIELFLKKLGLDQKESLVMMSVIKLGAQPSSVIARHAKIDRTTAYRILKKLTGKKLISSSKQRGVTVFYLEKLSDINHYIEKESERLTQIKKEFKEIYHDLETMRSSVQKLPRIQIYDGFDQLENFYRDIIDRAVEQKLLLIRILGSNTFSQQLEKKELGEVVKNFEKDMKKHSLETDILIAQGNLTREWLTSLNSMEIMANLPAAGGATNIILVGESVFMVSFRDFPVGIRMDHPDIAYTMHFLFDVARNSAKTTN